MRRAKAEPAAVGAGVLVVDDHLETAAALAGILERAGYRVAVAHTVAAALAARKSAEFAYLLCDINLPDGLGYEVVRQFCARGGTRCFAITGLSELEDVDASRRAGCEAHFMKPLSVTRILNAMAQKPA